MTKNKKMTVKKANKLISELTTKLISVNKDHEMDRIERKISILKDFIYFQKELENGIW